MGALQDEGRGDPDGRISPSRQDESNLEVSPDDRTASLRTPAEIHAPADPEIRPEGEYKTTHISPSNAEASDTAKRATFSPNDFVANRYKILHSIGQGGMGEVYEAEDVELRERVALKAIRPEFAREERALERFKREIQLARNVTHPWVDVPGLTERENKISLDALSAAELGECRKDTSHSPREGLTNHARH